MKSPYALHALYALYALYALHTGTRAAARRMSGQDDACDATRLPLRAPIGVTSWQASAFSATPRSTTMRFAAFVVAGVLLSAPAVLAKATSGEPRFPATVTEKVLQDFVQVGRVEAAMPRDRDAWFRWGGVPVEHQASAMRAVVDALTVARPPISLAAAILAIARVESGWNPYSRNPASTACGLFQFIRATWASYDDSQERCFDPKINAAAGVKHLMTLYQTRVGPRIAPLTPVTSEAERVAWTYRMLYALHYHGEAAPEATQGGSLQVQSVAEAGLPHLQGFFTILKRATAVPVRRVRAPARAKRRATTARTQRKRSVTVARSRAS